MPGSCFKDVHKKCYTHGIVNYQVVTVRSAKGDIIRYEAQGTAVRIE